MCLHLIPYVTISVIVTVSNQSIYWRSQSMAYAEYGNAPHFQSTKFIHNLAAPTERSTKFVLLQISQYGKNINEYHWQNKFTYTRKFEKVLTPPTLNSVQSIQNSATIYRGTCWQCWKFTLWFQNAITFMNLNLKSVTVEYVHPQYITFLREYYFAKVAQGKIICFIQSCLSSQSRNSKWCGGSIQSLRLSGRCFLWDFIILQEVHNFALGRLYLPEGMNGVQLRWLLGLLNAPCLSGTTIHKAPEVAT